MTREEKIARIMELFEMLGVISPEVPQDIREDDQAAHQTAG